MAGGFQHRKSFGQHFLKSEETALEIVNSLNCPDELIQILEIGPGHGILTKHLIKLSGKTIFVSEIDERIIHFLKTELQFPPERIIEGDFLRADIDNHLKGNFAVIGNFPYNISSQILFKVLEIKDQVPLLLGMFQREMAQRVTAKHGNKDYGVITVLVQAYFDVNYLFELPPEAFDPQPKVFSAVIRLTRKKENPSCSENLLRQVVKTAFNQRRKKLSNALASLHGGNDALKIHNFENLRAEQLSIEDFISLTTTIEKQR